MNRIALASAFAGALTLLSGLPGGARGQTVTALTNQQDITGTVYGFLMTDGTLLYQGGLLFDWWKYTPDAYGNYANGTWQLVAPLPPDYVPYATSGGVLPDGRLVLIGGEYLLLGTELQFVLTNKMAVYDPVADTWTRFKAPASMPFIGDAPYSILANGQLLLGDKVTKTAAVLDAKTLTWTTVSTFGKRDINAEEGWTLLPDGSLLTVDVKAHPHTERFLPNPNPALSSWISAGNTPVDLRSGDSNGGPDTHYDNGKRYYNPPGEVGPAILRPDGTVFAAGADCAGDCAEVSTVGHTAIYHPSKIYTQAGTWTAGPDFPNQLAAGDSYASLLPNGHVLVEANPVGAEHDKLDRLNAIRNGLIRPAALGKAAAPAATTPTWKFFEFDGAKLKYEPAADFIGGQASTLLLPTGEVMLNGQALYASTGTANPAWAPKITAVPATVTHGRSYTVSGTQFNGLSQANAFGDENQVATNYPLVRITNTATGHVVYARTHDHSSMGVATGAMPVSTRFDVPKTIDRGAATLEVVANGIASTPVAITVE